MFSVSVDSVPAARGFPRRGVFRSDGGLGSARTYALAPVHRLDEPTGYPSAWLRPRIASFRFTGRIIVAPRPSYGFNFRLVRYPPSLH